MRQTLTTAVLAAILAASPAQAQGQWLCAIIGGFIDQDITNVKASIKAEVENNGGTVEEVQMIRASCKKLEGFVKVSTRLFGKRVTLMKSCSATMGEGTYIWQCQ